MQPSLAKCRTPSFGLFALLLVLALPAEATPSGSRASRGRAETDVSSHQALRALVGISTHLDVATPTVIGGGKLLLGFQVGFGEALGWSIFPGIIFGFGEQAFLTQPVFDLHYSFDLHGQLVPWIGGGVSIKLGFAKAHNPNVGFGLRFLAGLDYFITEALGIGLQLTLPDLGPRLTPGFLAVGAIETTVGVHVRF